MANFSPGSDSASGKVARVSDAASGHRRARARTEDIHAALRTAEEIVMGLVDPAILLDRDLRPVVYNSAFADYAELRPRLLDAAFARGMRPFELLGAAPEVDRSHAIRVLATGRPMHLAEVEVTNSVGVPYVMLQSFVPVVSDEEGVVGLIEMLRDVSGEARLQKRYRELLDREKARARELELTVAERSLQLARMTDISSRDPLTGLFNRRAFDRLAENALAAARSLDEPMAVLVGDLDHFKSVNDHYGHSAGDAALTAVADALRGSVRGSDIIARVGGEEFVLAIPQASVSRATEVAERCAERVRSIPMSEIAPGSTRQLTISIGIAISARGEESVAALVDRADIALYQAKRRGRDRVILYSEELATEVSRASPRIHPHVLLGDRDETRATRHRDVHDSAFD